MREMNRFVYMVYKVIIITICYTEQTPYIEYARWRWCSARSFFHNTLFIVSYMFFFLTTHKVSQFMRAKNLIQFKNWEAFTRVFPQFSVYLAKDHLSLGRENLCMRREKNQYEESQFFLYIFKQLKSVKILHQ